MKKLLAVIGARPQFIKHFSIERACEGKLDLVTVHTGQHYDEDMSQVFFNELQMKKPNYILQGGGGNHGEQTGKILTELENVLIQEKPDMVLVYGDTNSTLAGALAAVKLHIKIAHVEAGIRSYNKQLPEEVNRLLTDQISDLLFTPMNGAKQNLKKEGIKEGVYNCGDVMKDVLDYALKKGLLKNQKAYNYYYATIHRPYNTDTQKGLLNLLDKLNALQERVVFAIHPRTQKKAKEFGIDLGKFKNIEFISPQSYLNNLSYIKHAKAVITDSGGIQKEAYWLKTKCITLRSETEWKETLANGWNILCFEDLSQLPKLLDLKPGKHPPLYTRGSAGKKIIQKIADTLAHEE